MMTLPELRPNGGRAGVRGEKNCREKRFSPEPGSHSLNMVQCPKRYVLDIIVTGKKMPVFFVEQVHIFSYIRAINYQVRFIIDREEIKLP